MQELIKIENHQIGAYTLNSVNARELHKILNIKRDFSNWIKAQIISLELLENEDFSSFLKKEKREIGATFTKEYIITLDTAKHIAMASRTPKGKEVRRYFIEVEKVYLREQQAKLERTKELEQTVMEQNKLLVAQKLFPKRVRDEYIADTLKLCYEREFDGTHTDFLQNRAKYFAEYVDALRKGGSELQKFVISTIDKAHEQRNQAQDKLFELEAKIRQYKLQGESL